ncbi:hypothetical protein [Terasakiella pusilla]|uniref:hypothetical protein n=1 Tax=Terasakiella pusilla TaxID=64973 RepID=UPI00048F7647|nr:hypothetical protein [Terasakiella pusilla]
MKNQHTADQVSGAFINNINQIRITDELLQQQIQDNHFKSAIDQIDKVREFVGSPENILGSDKTKHGEIAEQVEVGIRNARSALNGDEFRATFEGVGRTAPEDYIIDGIQVQSKFLNGTNNNLSAVIEHMEKYSSFGRDGSFYHIPKNEYEIIQKIIDGKDVEGLKLSTIEAIKKKITEIETQSGLPFNEVVRPGQSDYNEVQQGVIHKTLDGHEETLSEQNQEIKEQISEDHQANLHEGLQATAIAAAVGATVSLTTGLYKKYKEGKKFYAGDFSLDDWKEVGVETSKGGAIGATSGAAIYTLTNYAQLSAPFAAAMVSAVKGIGSLASDLEKGEINQEEFIELSYIVCSETAIVGFATVAGQAAIPIPVLGSVIGSLAGTLIAKSLGSNNMITTKKIREDLEVYLNQLDEKYKILVQEITTEFDKLGSLTEAAFNIENNLKALHISAELAAAHGVKKESIMNSVHDVDTFMLA